MRFVKIAMLIMFFGLCTFVSLQAATSVNISVSARLETLSPDMSVTIKELTQPNQDPWSGATVSTMDFGTLTHLLSNGQEAGVWYSPTYFCVFIFAYANSYKYEVRSTCSGLTSGSNTLPAGSFMLFPTYSSGDKWNPSDSTGQGTLSGSFGTYSPAVATNKLIYQSENSASPKSAILRAFYSIPNTAPSGSTGWQAIPLNQPGGVYTGTVTITIAAY